MKTIRLDQLGRAFLKTAGNESKSELCYRFIHDGPALQVPLWPATADPESTFDVRLDWYHDRLQVVFYIPGADDPVIAIRLNDDGTIAEIAVDPELMGKVRSDNQESPWVTERDKDAD